jgi:uncharacterized protein
MNKDTRNLMIFMAATFTATWTAYFTIVLLSLNPYTMPGLPLFLLGGSAPSWVGVLMVLFTYKKEQRRDYFRRCYSFKQIHLKWWVVILFLFPLIYALIVLLDMSLGSTAPGMDQLKGLVAAPWLIPLATLMSFLSGPWSEEFGWRGYSLDPLVKRFGKMNGAVVLGLIWGVWHLPLFLMPQTWHGQSGFHFIGFWSFMLYSIGLSCFMAWVYFGTNRSILSGFMIHLISNFTGNLLYPFSDRVLIIRTIVILVLGLALGVLMQRMSRPVAAPRLVYAKKQ